MEIISYYGTPFITNGYVLRDSGEAIIIDPGEITETMQHAIKDHTVTMVLNTHCHIDHCMANAEAVALTGAPLVLPEAELPLLHAMENQGVMFGVPVTPSPEPDRFIEGGDTVKIGAVELAVRSAPGHSPGHIILVGDGFVIGGDVLFRGSIGRTDLPGGNYQQLMDSIKREMLSLPDDTIVYSGHGPETTIGEERATNPFLQGL